MRRCSRAAWLMLIAVATHLCHPPIDAQVKAPSPIEQASRLDLLPTFKQSIKIGSVSSYDRTGGNDDGFNGTHSFIRKEPGGLVIADLTGPGMITRIWTPTPSDDVIEFYFDGETAPRIRVKFIDVFTGKQFPFLAPLSGIGAGGFYSYVPLAYKTSCKVVVKSERFNFYQINYATYPAKANLESYSAQTAAELKAHLETTGKLLSSAGTDISSYAAGSARIETHKFSGQLAAGKTLTIFESQKAGRIVGFKINPARAFAGRERDIVLRMYWDGDAKPAVEAPLGDFFGYSFGQPAVKSLPLGTTNNTNYIYLPMPYERAARIEVVSERAGGAIETSGEVRFTNEGKRQDEGRFYAAWRRENPTAEGKPYTFLETRGRGHAVGFVLQAQGAQPGAIPEFFEGDDETIIDGEKVIRGTGSEDFFNGGWYDVPGRWEDRVSLPLSGSLDFKRHLGRTGGYRFMFADAYPYRRNLLSTIEHGPVGNNFPADYTSVTFFYSEDRPTADLTLLPLAARRVSDPTKIVFTPGWTTPIHAFSWSNSSLAKRDDKVGAENLRHLSMRAEGREVFGAHYISFICEMPAAGRYRVSVQAIAGPAQGVVQMFRNEVGVGQATDLYSPERKKTPEMPLGELDLNEGDNRVMFKIVGENEKSSALGFDIYRIVFEKVR